MSIGGMVVAVSLMLLFGAIVTFAVIGAIYVFIIGPREGE